MKEAEYSDSERSRVRNISAGLWTVELPSLNNSEFRLAEWLCRPWSTTPARITMFSWSSSKTEPTPKIQYHAGTAIRPSLGNKSSEITSRKFTSGCPWSIWVMSEIWNICSNFESLTRLVCYHVGRRAININDGTRSTVGEGGVEGKEWILLNWSSGQLSPTIKSRNIPGWVKCPPACLVTIKVGQPGNLPSIRVKFALLCQFSLFLFWPKI